MKKIKVLHLVEDLKVGGLETVIATIVRGLDALRYAPEVWCVTRGGKIAEELAKEGHSVKILNIRTYYNILNFLKLASLLKEGKFDIIHTHGYFASTIGRVSARLAGIPVIITHMHSTYWDYTRRNLFIERFLSNFTDKIICCSNAVKDFVVRTERIDRRKVITIYNGIRRKDITSDIRRLRNSLGVNENDILITSVGFFFPHKGHKYLLDAVSQVKKLHENIKCLIAGDGPLREELRDYAGRLDIESDVKFLGVRRDIPEILSATDIFVLPSCEREGFAIAVTEAMAYGKPVIASRIGGLPEIVSDNKNGYLVTPKDSVSISQKLSELISDRDKRIKFGDQGKEVFEQKFSAQSMLSKIEDLYEEYCKSYFG